MRRLLLAGGAVAAFAALAVAAVAIITGGGRPPGPPSTPAAPQLPAGSSGASWDPRPPAPTQDARTGSPVLPAAPAAPPPMDPRPPPPPPGSWEAVPPAARPGALGPAGVAVAGELVELEPRLSACFEEVSQARHGQQPVTETRDGTLDEAGATVLMLQIEAGNGEVRIVDAPVESRGGASDGLIACAQRVLRGRRVAAPGVKPGQRFRLLHTLTQ